jgi:two-component system, cell cycle sensor histidine kinase and response regulator CckA
MLRLLHILMVEDSENDAALLLNQLREAGYETMSERVQTAEELTAALSRHTWDIILSDYVMPQFSGPDALKLVRAKNPDVPVIVISGIYGEEAAVEMMKAGANDYLVKSNLSRLAPAVQRELDAALTRKARAQAEAHAKYLAAIVESSDDAIYGMKLDGTVVSWNRAAERVYGFRSGEIIGRNVSILYPDERLDELIDTMERIKRSDHVGRSETSRLRKGGRLVPVSVTISPMKNTEGKISGASVIARDITSRKREEQERINLIQELTDALKRAKTLAGLLPICASCKRIRDDSGYWQQVEAYIAEHTDAVFTHGICPECFKIAHADRVEVESKPDEDLKAALLNDLKSD